MSKVYSDKQRALMRMWQRGELRRINLLEGSVRSGKTWISLVLWAFWVATMPKDASYLMVAKTLTSLRRNCLDLLTELVGANNFNYSLSKKEGRLFGRLIYLEGANDARSESKIRGMTLQGAYCDELTLFTEDFFAMLLSRLSTTGAKLFATTNPDSPNHWLMREYINRQDELDMLVLKFLIEDNPYLDPLYVENLKKEYVGMFYKRYILGLWVVAEGAIYDMFNDDLLFDDDTGPKLDSPYRRYIAIDYGTANPCVFLEILEHGGVSWVMREYYYDSSVQMRQKTDEEYADDLKEFIGNKPYATAIIDPSAASFKLAVRRKGIRTRDADNDVLDGIRLTASLFSQKKLRVHKDCVNLRKELSSYVWDDKAGEKGKEQPVKAFDHACDALRYYVKTIVRVMR